MFLFRPLRYLAQALTAEQSPRQFALGFALGLMVGLIPKGNLTALVLMTLLGAARVNLGAGLVSAFAFSWLAVFLDPVAHRIGLWLLTQEALQPMYETVAGWPLMPWTSFNNTVVLGNLVLGMLLFYPAYRGSEPFFARVVPPVQKRLQKTKIVAWLRGAEWSGRLSG